MPTPQNPTYRTQELELAAFIKASGYALRGAELHGRLVEFSFDAEAAEAAERYFGGAQLPCRDLFQAHRSLRALIQQVREHAAQKVKSYVNGTEQLCQKANPL